MAKRPLLRISLAFSSFSPEGRDSSCMYRACAISSRIYISMLSPMETEGKAHDK